MGRPFSAPPDAALLAFGSSLEDDLVLAPFDVHTSHGARRCARRRQDHRRRDAATLHGALDEVAAEIDAETFAAFARAAAQKTCTARSTRACANSNRRQGRCCMPGAAATTKLQRRLRSTRTIARLRARSVLVRSRASARPRFRGTHCADAACRDDALAAGATRSARLLADRCRRAVRARRASLHDGRSVREEQLSAGLGRGRGFDASARSKRGVQAPRIRSSLAQRDGRGRNARCGTRRRASLRACADRCLARQR